MSVALGTGYRVVPAEEFGSRFFYYVYGGGITGDGSGGTIYDVNNIAAELVPGDLAWFDCASMWTDDTTANQWGAITGLTQDWTGFPLGSQTRFSLFNSPIALGSLVNGGWTYVPERRLYLGSVNSATVNITTTFPINTNTKGYSAHYRLLVRKRL